MTSYELQIDPIDRIEAIYEDGSSKGQRISGRTTNGMRVSLDVADLPFSLSELEQTNRDTYEFEANNVRIYAISPEQCEAVLAALAAKVEAKEPRSRDPRTAIAMVAR